MAGHLGGSNSRGRRLNAKLDEIPLFLLYGSRDCYYNVLVLFSRGHTLLSNGLIECDNSDCYRHFRRLRVYAIFSSTKCVL